jgi:hypothetical protein
VIPQDNILSGDSLSFSFNSSSNSYILDKISKYEKLEKFCSVNNGVNTGNTANILLSEKKINEKYKKILEGKNIHRYSITWKNLYINYDSNLKKTIDIKSLKTKQNKIDFALRDENIFINEKIIIRQTSDKIIATLDTEGFITRHSTHCIVNNGKKINLKYLLGVLNSVLVNFYYQCLVPEKGKAFAEVKGINVKQIPIKEIDLKNKSEKAIHDEIVKQVELLLQLNAELPAEDRPTRREQMQGRIAYAEQRINELVYTLYGLTEEEIRIVEAG